MVSWAGLWSNRGLEAKPPEGARGQSGPLAPSGRGLGWADENRRFSEASWIDFGKRTCCAECPLHQGDLVRSVRMDPQSGTGQPDQAPAYTTSKQVQAWFLGRSRDRW